MFSNKDGDCARRTRFGRRAALFCLWLGVAAVLAPLTRGQDSNAELGADRLAPRKPASKSAPLPPLPETATYKKWSILGDGREYLSRCMTLGRHRTRTEWFSKQISVTDRTRRVDLQPRDKTALVTEYAQGVDRPDFVGHLRRLLADPEYSLDMSREMLGECEIDGRRAVGYRAIQNREILTIWADPDSLLPVQVEEVSWMSPGRRTLYNDFVFGEELDESLFSLEPPSDYTVQKAGTVQEDPTPIEENDLIELFRQYRRLVPDTFPYNVDGGASSDLRSWWLHHTEELSESQRQKYTEFSVKVDRGPRFVAGLPTDADAHYAGRGVKTDATDAPIFWYRPAGRDVYRVIRADLSVVEVEAPPEVPGAQAINDWGNALLAARSPWPDPGTRYDERIFVEGVQGGGELKYINDIPVLFVQGTPEDIGRQQGLLLADATRPLINLPKDLARQAKIDIAWPLVVRMCKIGLLRAPEQYRRELDAAAQAAELTEDELDALIVANVVMELQEFGGCSSLLVEPPRSATGAMLFGRNADYPPRGVLDRYGLVTIYRPEGKHAFASIGVPGLGGVISGMNDAGLALASHSAGRSRENEPALNPLGTPLYTTFRRILEECSSVEEAEEFLRRSKTYTKGILLVACDVERSAVFEITTTQVVRRDPEDHLLICTNHYRTPELCRSKKCTRYEMLARWRQREALLDRSDVRQAVRSVGNEYTIQSMVFEPESLRLYVALGILAWWDGPFAELDLNDLFRREVVEE